MPVKKAPVKKAATEKKTTAVKKAPAKVVSKPISKTVEKKIETKSVEVKKPHVVVETKRTDSCSCGSECECGWKCCCMKSIISILILINFILAIILCVRTVKTNAWKIETTKVGWRENMEKVIKLYESDYYVSAQSDSIDAYLSQINPAE